MMVAVIIVNIAVVMLSWLVTAIMPDCGLRSLLSAEGVRWTVGYFADHQQTPLLIWMLLLAIAFGTLSKSGLYDVLKQLLLRRVSRHELRYRQRFALQMAVLMFVLLVAVVVLMTCVSQAALMSITGSLANGVFPKSVVPLVAFAVSLVSVVYGYFSGTLSSLDAVFQSLHYGIRVAAPYLLLYVMTASLVSSLFFVFG